MAKKEKSNTRLTSEQAEAVKAAIREAPNEFSSKLAAQLGVGRHVVEYHRAKMRRAGEIPPLSLTERAAMGNRARYGQGNEQLPLPVESSAHGGANRHMVTAAMVVTGTYGGANGHAGPDSLDALREALRVALQERDALRMTLRIITRENEALERKLGFGGHR